MNEMEIATYLDGGMPLAAREAMEAHLVSCSYCRRDVAESRVLLRRVRRPRRLFVGAALAAAALLAVTLPLTRGGQNGERGSLLRSNAPAPTLAVHEPLGKVSLAGRRFVWGASRDAVTYRLTVTSADGSTIWSNSGIDTAVALPRSVTLVPGERYFWAVDALLNDGSTLTTGLREFAPVP